MVNFSSKNRSFEKISFKLLIIIYLLFLSALLVSTPSVAYFTVEQTVESIIPVADELEEKELGTETNDVETKLNENIKRNNSEEESSNGERKNEHVTEDEEGKKEDDDRESNQEETMDDDDVDDEEDGLPESDE